jgi:hypothetical protein
MFRACLHRWLWLGVWLAVSAARARAGSAEEFRREILAPTHYSVSRQFIAHDAPVTSTYSFDPGNAINLTRLDPDLLVISCERIKQAMLIRLGARDEWKGRIILDLHHCQNPNETLLVTPIITGQDWEYRIQLPDVMDRSRFVSAVVEVMLLEMANRNSTHSAEIPTWLAQGLAREVILSNPGDLVVDPPQTHQNGLTLSRLYFDNRQGDTPGKPKSDWMDPLAQAREYLRATPPMTLEELSWPRDGVLISDRAEAYRYSAQLLVHDLLQLPDGRANLQAMLRELPEHLNWQLSFLRAFHADFANQLAFDKWWTLQLATFSGRDLSQTWSDEQSWAKLDEVVRPLVEIRTSVAQPARQVQMSLQDILRNWDVARQEDLFREKSRQLFLLRLRVSQNLIYLVDDYRGLLDNYLRVRDRVVYFPMGHTLTTPRVDEVAHDTIREVDALDARRQQLRTKPAPGQPTAVSVTVNH